MLGKPLLTEGCVCVWVCISILLSDWNMTGREEKVKHTAVQEVIAVPIFWLIYTDYLSTLPG